MGTIYSLLIVLVGSIYELVAECFELFTLLSRTTTIEKSVYSNVIENFYLIIGVVMLFIIAFSLLKSMVSGDDDKGTENAGKVVKNFVTSIVILLLLPTIFSYAFAFQTAVVNQNTIGRIFGMNATATSGNSLASAGNDMANAVFTAFFTPTEEFCDKHQDEEKSCTELLKHGPTSLAATIEKVNTNGSFVNYSIFGDEVASGDLSFNFFVLFIAGLYLVYVIVSFCLDLGLRLVKLVFYQIIAPVPVFMRVVPEGKLSNSFNEWLKITITCYIEVFLRLLVLYFSVFLISAFLNGKGLGELFNESGGLIAKAIIVLSVLTFMKQAPKLIGDLFGIDTSNMKLGIMDKLAALGMVAASANKLGGAIGSFVASEGRNPLAAIRGWKNGIGNIGAEAKRRQEYKDARAAGVTKKQMLKDYMLSKAGFGSQADIEKGKIEDNDYEVSNESGKDIVYTKPNGEKVTIGKGEKNKKINAADIESMEAAKAENVSKISAHRDRIKNLEQEAASGSARIQHKSNLKSEAEKKIDEAGSTVLGEFTYYEPDVNGNIEFNSDGELIAGTEKKFTGTYEQIKHFKMNNLSARQIETAQSDESIRDKMIADYIIEESKKAGSKIARDMYSGFKSIQYNEGYEFYTYEYEVDEKGKIKKDKNGKEITKKDKEGEAIIRKIKFNVEQDENGAWRVDRKSLVDENGRELSEQSVKDFGLIGIEKSDYDLISKIDKIAKTSNGIIENKKQFIQEKEINTIQAQNEAIDAIKQQFNDVKDAALKTHEMRQQEISSKYIANHNNNK